MTLFDIHQRLARDTVSQAAGKAVPAHMTQLQRDVLQLASGDARGTRYAMLANALLLLLAPLPTDITEQVQLCTTLFTVLMTVLGRQYP